MFQLSELCMTNLGKVTGVPFFGGPTSAELCLLPQGTPLRRLSFGTGMNFIVNQPDELKMISANADNIIYNAGWIGTSAELEANDSTENWVEISIEEGDALHAQIIKEREAQEENASLN